MISKSEWEGSLRLQSDPLKSCFACALFSRLQFVFMACVIPLPKKELRKFNILNSPWNEIHQSHLVPFDSDKWKGSLNLKPTEMKVEPTVYVRLLFGALVSISSFLRSPQRHWPTMLLNITVKLEPELPHFKVIKNTQLKPLITFFQFKDSSWTARDILPSISKAIDCLSYGNGEVSF